MSRDQTGYQLRGNRAVVDGMFSRNGCYATNCGHACQGTAAKTANCGDWQAATGGADRATEHCTRGTLKAKQAQGQSNSRIQLGRWERDERVRGLWSKHATRMKVGAVPMRRVFQHESEVKAYVFSEPRYCTAVSLNITRVRRRGWRQCVRIGLYEWGKRVSNDVQIALGSGEQHQGFGNVTGRPKRQQYRNGDADERATQAPRFKLPRDWICYSPLMTATIHHGLSF